MGTHGFHICLTVHPKRLALPHMLTIWAPIPKNFSLPLGALREGQLNGDGTAGNRQDLQDGE